MSPLSDNVCRTGHALLNMAPGIQLTTLTHVADVASMLAKARAWPHQRGV